MTKINKKLTSTYLCRSNTSQKVDLNTFYSEKKRKTKQNKEQRNIEFHLIINYIFLLIDINITKMHRKKLNEFKFIVFILRCLFCCRLSTSEWRLTSFWSFKYLTYAEQTTNTKAIRLELYTHVWSFIKPIQINQDSICMLSIISIFISHFIQLSLYYE